MNILAIIHTAFLFGFLGFFGLIVLGSFGMVASMTGALVSKR